MALRVIGSVLALDKQGLKQERFGTWQSKVIRQLPIAVELLSVWGLNGV